MIMILTDPAKSGLKSAWCMDSWMRFPEQRQKHYLYEKQESCYSFCALYLSENHAIHHRIITAILDVILNILQR